MYINPEGSETACHVTLFFSQKKCGIWEAGAKMNAVT